MTSDDNWNIDANKSCGSASHVPYYRSRKCRFRIRNLDYENPILQIMDNILDHNHKMLSSRSIDKSRSIDNNSNCQRPEVIKDNE
jgi:hypothetical protein